MASLCARITPALAPMEPFSAKSIRRNKFLLGTHLLHHGSRETIVDKTPCLRAYAPSGIRTRELQIASREHEPLHHSAPTVMFPWFILVQSTRVPNVVNPVTCIFSLVWSCTYWCFWSQYNFKRLRFIPYHRHWEHVGPLQLVCLKWQHC